MSKSTPSTSTVQNINPLGLAQQPYYMNMLGAGAGLAGWNGSGVGPAVGQDYLTAAQNYAYSQGNATQGATGNLVPSGAQFLNAALTGQGNQFLPSSSQIQSLSDVGQGAVNTGNYYGNQIQGLANYSPGAVAPYATGLTNLSGQYGGLTGAGYGSYGALNSTANQAANAGQMTAQQLYGLAPQGMTAGYPSEQQLMANSGMAINSNPAFSSGLTGLASGAYINPSTNPALGGVLSSALTPLAKQFMTATAPQTDSNFESAGRYGSGAQTNAQGQNQYALGQAMSNAASGIVNNAYNQGLNTTLGAGSALGSIFNQGMANSTAAAQAGGTMAQGGVGLTGNLIQGGGAALNTGYGTAGNIYGTGANALNSLGGTGLGGAANTLNLGGNMTLAGLQQAIGGNAAAAAAANAGYGTGTTAYGQGGNLANSGILNLGSLAQIAPSLANYPESQYATAFNTNWMPIQNFAGILGQPIGGNTVTDTTQNMSQNIGSQLLSGLTGAGALVSALRGI